MDIDVQGAMNIKKAMPSAVLVFILPPSYQVLRQRLTDRGTETQEQIERRLQTAQNEIQYIDEYDYCILNDTVQTAAQQLENVLAVSHLRVGDRKQALLAHWEEEK